MEFPKAFRWRESAIGTAHCGSTLATVRKLEYELCSIRVAHLPTTSTYLGNPHFMWMSSALRAGFQRRTLQVKVSRELGQSILHSAARLGKPDVLMILQDIDYGDIDPELEDDNKMKAVDYFTERQKIVNVDPEVQRAFRELMKIANAKYRSEWQIKCQSLLSLSFPWLREAIMYLSSHKTPRPASSNSWHKNNQRWACYSDAMLLAHTIMKKEF